MAQNPTPPVPRERLERWRRLDRSRLPSPCLVLDTGALEENARKLADVRARCGAKVLLALKGFALPAVFPLLKKYLDGTTASGLYEARLGRETFGGQTHVYAPAYRDGEVRALTRYADHIVFNSPEQWQAHRAVVEASERPISCALRINPEYAEIEPALYNPCAPHSRLGTPFDAIDWEKTQGLEGLHFHALCEQNADTLARVLAAFERRFGDVIGRFKWVNFGGGHHIARTDYDVDLLCNLVSEFKKRHGVEVYLEPGEGAVLGTAFYRARVLEAQPSREVAVLDLSAACHAPDVLEMPYRPDVLEASEHGAHRYWLGGPSCLAGDVFGRYAFERPLAAGDSLTFLDMAHYTTVKATTFNGVPLPAIALYDPNTQKIEVVKTFGYDDYKDRLGV